MSFYENHDLWQTSKQCVAKWEGKEGTISNGEEKGPQSCDLRPSTQPHSKVLQQCMIVYRGAEKSTPYYGNEGLSDDPEKTWYRTPSLRRDWKGSHETTSLHQETNWDWISNTKQKSWQMREDAHGPEQYTVPSSSVNLGSLPISTLILTASSLYAQSTQGRGPDTHTSHSQGWFPTEGLLQIYVYILKT